MKKLFYILWGGSILSLFLYSFTQIDLSLVVSRNEFVYSIQQSFQYVGYFNRPLSTLLFTLVLALLFSAYIFTIWGVKKDIFKRKDIWIVLLPSALILTLSYNAFSYDIFNYIFDAKIITEYGDNPYQQKALDYPGDPMLTFMRWTHRIYPYGPVWLVATVPLSYAGLGYFVPTYGLFKLLAAAAFIGCAYCIEQIAIFLKKKKTLLPLTLFALNPFVLIESLSSAHNDIVMLFFAIAGILMYLEKKYILSGLSLLVSIGIKFATAVLVPALLIYKLIYRKKQNITAMFVVFTLFLFTATIAATIRTQFQPWYLLYPLSTAVFLGEKRGVVISICLASLFAILQHTPYIYVGNWDPPIPDILNFLTLLITASCLIPVVAAVHKKIHR